MRSVIIKAVQSKGNHCNWRHLRKLKGPFAPLTGRYVPLTGLPVPLTVGSGPLQASFAWLSVGWGPAVSSWQGSGASLRMKDPSSAVCVCIYIHIYQKTFLGRVRVTFAQGALKVTELRWQRAPKTQIFAENRRFSQIHPLLLEIPAFGGRRKPQKPGNRRFSQKTAGNRRLGSVTLGASPLARPYLRTEKPRKSHEKATFSAVAATCLRQMPPPPWRGINGTARMRSENKLSLWWLVPPQQPKTPKQSKR